MLAADWAESDFGWRVLPFYDGLGRLGGRTRGGFMSDVDRNLQVVKSAYDAFGRGDVSGVLAVLDDNVDWHPILGAGTHVPMAGKRSGRAGAAEFFKLLDQHNRFKAFEPREFIASGDRVIVLGTYTG